MTLCSVLAGVKYHNPEIDVNTVISDPSGKIRYALDLIATSFGSVFATLNRGWYHDYV